MENWFYFQNYQSYLIFEDNLKITSVLFFIADFNLLSCEFDSLTFKLLYWAIIKWYFHILFYFLLVDQKRFFHQSQHCNPLFLHLEDNNFFFLFFVNYLQILKQKVYLLLENLVQLNDLNLGFVLIILCVNCSFKFWF